MSMKHYLAAVKLVKKMGKRARFAGPKSEAVVAAAEKALGLKFPPSYRQFCLDFGAGKFCGTEIYGVLEKKDFKHDCARQYTVGRGHGGEGYVPSKGESFELLDTLDKTMRHRKQTRGYPKNVVVFYTLGYGGGFALLIDDPTGQEEAAVVNWSPKTRRGKLSDYTSIDMKTIEALVAGKIKNLEDLERARQESQKKPVSRLRGAVSGMDEGRGEILAPSGKNLQP